MARTRYARRAPTLFRGHKPARYQVVRDEVGPGHSLDVVGCDRGQLVENAIHTFVMIDHLQEAKGQGLIGHALAAVGELSLGLANGHPKLVFVDGLLGQAGRLSHQGLLDLTGFATLA